MFGVYVLWCSDSDLVNLVSFWNFIQVRIAVNLRQKSLEQAIHVQSPLSLHGQAVGAIAVAQQYQQHERSKISETCLTIIVLTLFSATERDVIKLI